MLKSLHAYFMLIICLYYFIYQRGNLLLAVYVKLTVSCCDTKMTDDHDDLGLVLYLFVTNIMIQPTSTKIQLYICKLFEFKMQTQTELNNLLT